MPSSLAPLPPPLLLSPPWPSVDSKGTSKVTCMLEPPISAIPKVPRLVSEPPERGGEEEKEEEEEEARAESLAPPFPPPSASPLSTRVPAAALAATHARAPSSTPRKVATAPLLGLRNGDSAATASEAARRRASRSSGLGSARSPAVARTRTSVVAWCSRGTCAAACSKRGFRASATFSGSVAERPGSRLREGAAGETSGSSGRGRGRGRGGDDDDDDDEDASSLHR